jgi:hypothetical protein
LVDTINTVRKGLKEKRDFASKRRSSKSMDASEIMKDVTNRNNDNNSNNRTNNNNKSKESKEDVARTTFDIPAYCTDVEVMTDTRDHDDDTFSLLIADEKSDK